MANVYIDELELATTYTTSDEIILEQTDATRRAYLYRAIGNLSHPVGSVFITSTNSSPSSYLGGTWTLIDKEFKSTRATTLSTTYATLNNATAISGYWRTYGHEVHIQARITNSVELADSSITLVTFDLASMGLTSLNSTPTIVGYSDGGNGIVMLSLTYSTGALNSLDVVINNNSSDTATIASGKYIDATFALSADYNKMVDSFCDKFYWERTA